MSKKPPHGGKPPNPRKPQKRGPKGEVLFIDDIEDALSRIWKAPKPARK